MDDKELPGFKINDYNGDGDDVAEEAGEPAENGSVAHGEGDFSTVMLENEHVGGAGEKAPKTAPEALEEHPGDSEGASEEASGEPKTDSRVEASKRITEAEARAMLVEDNARAKEALKKANSRGKKTLAVVIVVAVLLVVAGVVTSIILGGMRKSDGAGSGNGNKQEGNGGNAAVVEKPEEKPSEPEVVELSLDDEVVQRVYGNFQGIARLFDGWWEFYVDDGVKNGEISQEKMLLLAGANYPEGTCVGYYEYGNGGVVTYECVSGEVIRQKVAEMFGQEIILTEGDKLGSFCAGKPYNVANDEFFQAGNGCGGTSPISMERVLMKAERKGDEMVLYEKVLMFDEMAYYTVGETEIIREAGGFELGVAGEKLGEYTVPEDVLGRGYEVYHSWLEEKEASLAREYGTQFKWTFERDAEGNYVFKGLERVN